MPLIKAIRSFLARRMQVSEPFYPIDPLGSPTYGGFLWVVVLVIALPAVAGLVLVGFLYEVVNGVDRRRLLPGPMRWLIAAALGVAVTVALVWLIPRMLSQ